MTQSEQLYNSLLNKGYTEKNLGDRDTFLTKMQDKENRRKLYDFISKRGDFRIGNYENYEQRIASDYLIPQPLQENIVLAKSNPMDKVNPALRTQSAKPIGDVQVSQNIGNRAALTFEDVEPMPEASAVLQRNADATTPQDAIQQAVSQDLIGQAASQEWQRDTEHHYKSEKERLQALYNKELAKTSGRQFSSSFMDYNPSADTAMSRDASLYSQALQYINDAEHHMSNVRNDAGLAQGVSDAIFDIDTLTLGLDSLSKNATLKAILDKADADQPLTQAEESLLNAALYKQFTEAALPNGRWYNVGRSIGEQVPHMLEFALSGGVAGALTKGASKAIGKQVVKYINNLALKNGSKIANRTARNVFARGSRMLGNTLYQLPGGVMRAAAQTPLRSSVYNNIIERQIGTLGYKPGEDGTLDYTGRIDADNTADAITKGLISGFITNLTESSFGEGIQFITNKIGGLMGKGISAVAKDFRSPRWYNRLRESFRRNGFGEFVKATSWQGPVAEYGEELLDQTLNAIFVGDSSLDPNSENYVFDLDNLIDTAITTGAISLFMGAAGGIASGKIHRDVNKAYALAEQNLRKLRYTDTEINALNKIATSRPQEASKWVSSITRTMRTLAIRRAEIENSLSPEARTLTEKPYTDAEFNELSPYDKQAVLALEEIKYRFNDLSIQRDYVVAGINYNALSKGLKESVAPQAEAAMADIQANALRDSDYTIKVTFRGQDGYLVSGTADIDNLPDGRTVATLPAGNIYQVRTKSPDGQWIIQQAVAEDIVPGSVTPTQQLIDETTARIYSPVQNLINAEQAQAQAEVAQSTEQTTPTSEQTTSPSEGRVEGSSPSMTVASKREPSALAQSRPSDSNLSKASNPQQTEGAVGGIEAPTTSPSVQTGTSTNSTQAKLAHIASWQQAIDVPIVIFHDISEVDNPQAVANIQAGNTTPGWITNGTVYIYLPHAKDERDIDATIMHECIAHFGIPRLFATQEQADAFYDEVWNAMPEAEQYRLLSYPGVSHIKGEKARRVAADEYIAHLAEQIRAKRAGEAEVSLWQRIVAFFRNALRRANVNLRLNDTDLTQLLLQSLDALKKNNEQPQDTTSDNALDANEVAVTLPSNGTETRFSIRSFREEGRAKVTNWLNRRVKSRRITKQEAQDILDQLDTIYDICQEYTTQYAPFGDWSEAQVNVDANGNPVLSVIKSNGEYAMNLDFSLVCKKRRTLDAVFQEMITRDIINDFELDGVQVAKINEIIRSYGFETACRLCFVDAKRFRIAAVADTFVELFNEISSMSDRKLRQVIKEEPTTVRGETAQLLLNDPSQRIKVSRSDFMSAEGFERIKRDYPEIMKLYNAKKGTGGPKASFGDVQYLNEIENRHQWTPNKAYSVGGVRLQSFSDYVPRMVFDYVQMIADLAAKHLPVHAYTKEDIFAKQFGLTGIKINLSLVPRVDPDGIAPGLDRDGNYVWQEGETFPYDTAIAIQNAPGYRDNCGTIAVGVSDAHILKMLDDENIRMVIPYHKSGLNPAVAIFNNIDAFVDYTNEQNTRYESGSKLSKDEKQFNFNEALRKAKGNPRIAAQQYLDWCRQNNYLPKFDKFASHPNYYKLLEDFTTMYTVDGVDTIVPQHAVEMRFPTEQDAFGSMRDLIAEGLDADAILEGQRNEQLSAIVDEIAATLPPKTQAKTKTKTTDTRFRIGDNEQTALLNAKQPKTIQPLVDIAIADTRFRITKRTRETIDTWLNRRTDLNTAERNAFWTYIENEEPAKQLAMGKWFANGAIRLPEDQPTVDDAMRMARKMNIDPLQYNAPGLITSEYHERFGTQEQKETQALLSPDDERFAGVLTDKVDYGNGITVYTVQDDAVGQDAVRTLMNDHLGKNFNCWCLLYADSNGNITESARNTYWKHYNSIPKRVAFKDGKICSFCASNNGRTEWWDISDQSHGENIPVEMELPEDAYNRRSMYEFNESTNEFSRINNSPIFRGNKKNGRYEEWYSEDTHSLALRANYKGGKLHGLYESWHENGQPNIRSNYKDGKRDGLSESWYNDGALFSRENCKNGKRDGLREEWYNDGTISSRENYKDGKRDGLSQYWYTNGQLCIHANYKLSIRDGIYEEWYYNGQLRIRESYKNGQLDDLREEWYENGQLNVRANYTEGKLNGLVESWDENGQPKVRATYKDGERDGLYESWDGNGQPRTRETYKDGKRDGLGESWYENGQLNVRANYKDGERDGLGESWYENGQPLIRANYTEGKLNGLFESWNENGQPNVRANYTEGKLNGLFELWDNNGNLIGKSKYVNGDLVESIPATSFRSINPSESLSDYARAVAANGQQTTTPTDINTSVALATANDKNKLPDTPIRFRMTRRTESTVTGWINRRTDLTPDERKAVIDHIDNLDGTTLQLATAKWFAQGTIRIPEDNIQVEQAIKVASRAKVDPLAYDYPQAIISAFPEAAPKQKPINPDDVPTLTNKQELPNDIVVYDVDNSEESMRNMREIINTHLGVDANPWCILQANKDGILTDTAHRLWRTGYNSLPRRVAFHNGRLIAFFATGNSTQPIWWDRQDLPHIGIPFGREAMNDGSGRYIYNFFNEETGEIYHEKPHSGNRQNGIYREWDNNGNLIEESHYSNGRLNGIQKQWDYTRNTQHPDYTETSYVDGNTDGYQISKDWLSNKGLYITSFATIRNGSLHGIAAESAMRSYSSYVINNNFVSQEEWETYLKDHPEEKEWFNEAVSHNPISSDEDANTPETRFRIDDWDMNTGYTQREDGSRISVRALDAEENGAFTQGKFCSHYGVARKDFDILLDLGIIVQTEWHHTGANFKESKFYSWADSDRNKGNVDYSVGIPEGSFGWIYSKNKKRISSLGQKISEQEWKFGKPIYPQTITPYEQYRHEKLEHSHTDIPQFEWDTLAQLHKEISQAGDTLGSARVRAMMHQDIDIEWNRKMTEKYRTIDEESIRQEYDQMVQPIIEHNKYAEEYNSKLKENNLNTDGKEKTIIEIADIFGLDYYDKVLIMSRKAQRKIIDNLIEIETNKIREKAKKLESEKQKKIDKWIAENRKKGNITDFHRVTAKEKPEYSIVEKEEMNGRYGWFDATSRYNLQRYYSGFAFATKRLFDSYQNKLQDLRNTYNQPGYNYATLHNMRIGFREINIGETPEEYVGEILKKYEEAVEYQREQASTTSFRSIAADNRTADYALDTIEQATADYADSLNTERKAIIDAITPSPDDSLRTIAEKTRLRSIGGELITRDNTELEDFLALANKISNAMTENDARHKHTAIAESQYDSMQRLHNLIDDLRKQGALIDDRFDPWLTQNQARSRAQAETKVFDLTYRQPLYEAIARGIRALFPGINTKDKAENAKGYSHLSLYAQARTAIERQEIKSAQARAEAEEKGEEYKERDFGGLAGIQEAIFGLYSAIDNDVEAVKGNIEKLTALATERGIPTVQEYIDNAEAKLGNPDTNGTAANQLWTAIRSISAYQLTYSYNAGITSRAGYQTLTYGRNIDALLREKYDMQVKQIKDNPGSYDNVTDYDKDGNATGTRKVLNDNARIVLNQLNQEYADAIDAVPMPGKNGNWQHLIDTGWLTEEDVNSLHRYYMYYMPLKGHAELTAEDIVEYENKTPRNQSKIKAVEGHSHLAKDPFNQLILDTHGAIQNAEQNRWRLNLYNILTNNPNPSQYVVEQRFYKIETQSDGSKEYVPYGELKTINGAQVFIPGRPTAEEIANGTAVSYNNRFTRAEVDIPIRNDQRKEHSVTVMVDGEAYNMFFYDKRIADAINGTNIKRPSEIWKQLDKLQALNRLYAGLKTSLNPTFTLISNLPRDWMEMVSNNLIEHGFAHAVTSFIYRVRATRAGDVQAALRKYQDGKLLTLADATTDVERYVVEFFNNGGSVNITQLPDYNTAKVELMDDLNTYMRTGEMPKGGWLSRNFNNMAERVELAPRLATYIASRTLGRNISQSVNDAKEATVNFDRKGSWSGIMGMFQLFYNAAAQSVRRQIGLARRHPVRFAATYATIGLLSPLNNIMMSYIMSMLLGDDDDLENIVRNYFAINPELRRRYNIILIGNDYIRIPMAVNYLPYVTLGDVIANWRLNPNYRPNILEDTLDIASAILDTFLPSMIAQPIGFAFDAITAKNNEESANASRAIVFSLLNKIPVIEPLIQAVGNYNFMGSTLFDMPYDKNSQEPAYLRARQYTQPVWVWASHLLNDITGGNEVHAGWLNIAPEQIENVMTVFGGYGEYAENIISLGIETVSILSGEKPDTEVFKKSFPLLSRLYGGNTQERYDKSMQSMFYDDTTALAGFNEYRKNATTASTRADFDREYSPDEQRYFADLATMESIAKKIRKEIKAATPEGEAPKYHADERLKAIYNLANEQFHSLASGEYKPIDNPYYTYMYIKDAIEKAPHRTTDGTYRLIDRSERSADSRGQLKQLLQSFSKTRSMYKALPSGYYPGMPLDNREEQALNRFNTAVGELIQAYQNTDLNNLTPADNAQ